MCSAAERRTLENHWQAHKFLKKCFAVRIRPRMCWRCYKICMIGANWRAINALTLPPLVYLHRETSEFSINTTWNVTHTPRCLQKIM